MSTVFVGQTSLRIELDAGIDISAATTVKIKYRKPSGAPGEWVATKNATKGFYDLAAPSPLDEKGSWTLWLDVTFSDTRTAPGEAVTMIVKKPGEV